MTCCSGTSSDGWSPARLELQALVEQLREGAAGEERLRLARELHDGVLQSLTAASLHVQRARQAVSSNRADAEQRLAMVEETLLSEHQALRLAIAEPPARRRQRPRPQWTSSNTSASRRRAWRGEWDIRVHLNLHRDITPLPPRMVHEISRMVQEALVNAIRHGSAKEATVTCIASAEELLLAVSYEGRGLRRISRAPQPGVAQRDEGRAENAEGTRRRRWAARWRSNQASAARA